MWRTSNVLQSALVVEEIDEAVRGALLDELVVLDPTSGPGGDARDADEAIRGDVAAVLSAWALAVAVI